MDRVTRKIKIFSTFQDVATLEVEINEWLVENPNIRVIQLLQYERNQPSKFGRRRWPGRGINV